MRNIFSYLTLLAVVHASEEPLKKRQCRPKSLTTTSTCEVTSTVFSTYTGFTTCPPVYSTITTCSNSIPETTITITQTPSIELPITVTVTDVQSLTQAPTTVTLTEVDVSSAIFDQTIINTLSIPGIQTTITQTVTATATATALCSNAGIAWAYYSQGYSPFLDSFAPQISYTTIPACQSQTGSDCPGVRSSAGLPYFATHDGVGGFYNTVPDDTSQYGQLPNSTIYGVSLYQEFYWLMQTAYFIPPVDGTYYFYFQNVDDVLFFWFGDVAYSGWNAANTVVFADAGNSEGNGGQYYSKKLTGGQYYATRVLFGQGPGSATFGIDWYIETVIGDQGYIVDILDSGTNDSPLLQQFSCADPTAHPAFVPYTIDSSPTAD